MRIPAHNPSRHTLFDFIFTCQNSLGGRNDVFVTLSDPRMFRPADGWRVTGALALGRHLGAITSLTRH